MKPLKHVLILFPLIVVLFGVEASAQLGVRNQPTVMDSLVDVSSNGQILLDDDFDGPPLNEGLWHFGTNSAGSGYTIDNGVLVISSGTTNGGGAWILSNEQFTPQEVDILTFETRTAVSVADGGFWGFWGDNHDGVVAIGVTTENQLKAWVRPDNAAPVSEIIIENVNPTDWYTYRIEIEGSIARFYVNDTLRATHTENIPVNKAMHIRLDRVSFGENRTLSVDYVRLIADDVPILFSDDFSTEKGWLDQSNGYFYRDVTNEWLVFETYRSDTRRRYIPINAQSESINLEFRFNVTSFSGNGSVIFGLVEDLVAPVQYGEINATGFFTKIFRFAGGNHVDPVAVFGDGQWYHPHEEARLNFQSTGVWRKVVLQIDQSEWELSVLSDSGDLLGQSNGMMPDTHSAYNYLMVFFDEIGGWETATGYLDDVVITGTSMETSLSSISGQVRDDDDNPLSGVDVIVNGEPITTADSEGNYIITGLATGTHTITVSMDNYTFLPISRTVTAPPDAIAQDFTGTPLAYSISGQVIDGSGYAISGVTITTSAGVTTTDTEGHYLLSEIPADAYTISASKSGYTFSPSSREVTVPPDAIEQDFTGATITFNISGVVVADTGDPVNGVTISVIGGSSTTTDSLGQYTLTNIPGGIYFISAHKSGYKLYPPVRSITIPGGDSSQDFVATPTQ